MIEVVVRYIEVDLPSQPHFEKTYNNKSDSMIEQYDASICGKVMVLAY